MPDAILYIRFETRISSSYFYDAAKAKLSARCGASGVVWNAEDSGPRFEGATVQVTFLNGADDRMRKYAADHGLDGACGSIVISKELVAETYEDTEAWETVTLPQIEIWVGVDQDSFRLIEAGLASSVSGGSRATMSVHFGHRDFTGIVMPLESLDLSSKSDYPIVSFDVNCIRMPAEPGG